MKKNAARLEKTSHAGIIRIGFEGISQPHTAWSTPVSVARLKHPTGAIGKFDGRVWQVRHAICKIDRGLHCSAVDSEADVPTKQ
jgi:hypothetical protein